jgi:glycerol kinase
MEEAERERLYRQWKKAVTRTFDWVDEDTEPVERALAQEETG